MVSNIGTGLILTGLILVSAIEAPSRASYVGYVLLMYLGGPLVLLSALSAGEVKMLPCKHPCNIKHCLMKQMLQKAPCSIE